jgi:flavin-dependent dehydrogenase
MTNPSGETPITVAQATPVNTSVESGPAREDAATQGWDAVVMGAGPGGLAAAIHLRRGGLRVLCVEPDKFPHDRVGESLDWSSPGMLAQLGISRESLIADQVATYKRHIEIVTPDRPPYQAQPEAWFQNPPLKFETITLHTDRKALDQRLFDTACQSGAEFLWDRVTEIESAGEQVTAVRTAGGQRIEARWFIDASGLGARLLARQFKVPKIEYGKKKVCLWCHFETPIRTEGTTFYANVVSDEYLSWIWEIPISPKVTSVGCVMSADFVKQQRRQGKETHQILWDALAAYTRFDLLVEEQRGAAVHSASYQSYVHTNACGPNWLMVGEAASLPDPLTANGVTAAFRHAAEGVKFILESNDHGTLTARQRRVYNTNVQRMGHVFNHSIETSIYDNSIRWGLGVMPAQKIYTAFSYTVNALYTKYRPQGWLSMLCFGVMMKGVWAWMEGWALLGRVNCILRPGLKTRHLQVAPTR